MPVLRGNLTIPPLRIWILHATRVDEADVPPEGQAHFLGRMQNAKGLLVRAAIILN
jgi:hypothetical protein